MMPRFIWRISAAARIEREGGRIVGVRTDHQFKSEKARLTNQATPGRRVNSPETEQRKREIAAQLHLKVIHGRTYPPDLQVEYRDRSGQERHENLEVTTDSYRSRDTGPKVAAGFSMSVLATTSKAHGVIKDGLSHGTDYNGRIYKSNWSRSWLHGSRGRLPLSGGST